MDYTPISARRVLVAFSLTVFVALLPVFYLALQRGSSGLSVFSSPDGRSRDTLLVVGSVVLTAAVMGALVLVMLIARRVARRPARA